MAGGAGARLVWPVPFSVDAAGVPRVGAQLFTYITDTNTPLQTYNDPLLTVPNTNPIIADELGQFGNIFMLPASYRVRLLDTDDTEIWTADPVGFATTVTGAVQVGSQMPFAGSVVPAGWLLEYGQAVSRTVYALLFAQIGTAYGVGNGTTTFNLPDRRGRASIGKDDMGGVAANRVTLAGSGINALVLGATGGSQLSQIHVHTGSSDPHTHTVTDPKHAHGPPNGDAQPANGLLYWDTIGGPGHFLPGVFLPAGLNRGNTSSSETGISIDAATTTVTLDPAGAGSSQNMIPCCIDNWIIFAGA